MQVFARVRCILIILMTAALLSCHAPRNATYTSSAIKTGRTGDLPESETKQREYKPLRKRQLKRKYADILQTKPGNIKNLRLYYFIDEWSGVRYKFGGNNKAGIDCSGFVHQLYESVYGVKIKRTVRTMHEETKNFRKQRKLKEGQLVYFKEADDPSHVGVYLMNGFFVHSSGKEGVHISSLSEEYWKKNFAGGGKVRKRS